MKAPVYVGEEKLDFREVADPVVNSGEQLIKVDSAGICGSDMHAYLGHDERRPAPLILGHEASGIILGGDRNGDRVAINPLVTCRNCLACISGRENICSKHMIRLVLESLWIYVANFQLTCGFRIAISISGAI